MHAVERKYPVLTDIFQFHRTHTVTVRKKNKDVDVPDLFSLKKAVFGWIVSRDMSRDTSK